MSLSRRGTAITRSARPGWMKARIWAWSIVIARSRLGQSFICGERGVPTSGQANPTSLPCNRGQAAEHVRNSLPPAPISA